MSISERQVYRVLGSLDHDSFKTRFARLWMPLTELLGELDTTSLQSRLNAVGILDDNGLNGWMVPDAVWQWLCLRDPGLAAYPMGEIAERSVKKLLVYLIVAQPWDGTLPGEDEVESSLVKRIQQSGMDVVALQLATLFLFEACVKQLRLYSVPLMLDSGYWYQFSSNHRMMPTKLQLRMRRQIFEQCLQYARRYVRDNQQEVAPTTAIKVNVVASGKSLAQLRREYPIGVNPVRLLLHGKSANVSFDADSLARELSNIRSKGLSNGADGSTKANTPRLGTLARDFFDLGAVVYMADIQAKRSSDLGRELGILLPVRNLSRWERASEKVEQAIAVLGRDRVKLYLMERKESRRYVAPSPESYTNNRCVCLFSGGIDALAGAVWALEQGLAPVFVSHYANYMIGGLQKRLVKSLGQIYQRDLPHIGVMIGRKSRGRVRYKLPRPPKSPMTQNLRAFMFLSIASAVAVELGIDRIYMFENGPMALNPLVSEARVNTRAVDPHLLDIYEKLLATVSEVDIQIENPFLYWTKGEVTELLAKEGVSDLLSSSISCWKWFIVPPLAKTRNLDRPQGCFHCGECIPCLIRRASAYHAGLSDQDTPYLYDVLKEFPASVSSREEDPAFREVSTAIADYLRFNQLLLRYDDAGLLAEVPDFSLCVNGVDCRRLADTHRRHSRELFRLVSDGANAQFQHVFGAAIGEPT